MNHEAVSEEIDQLNAAWSKLDDEHKQISAQLAKIKTEKNRIASRRTVMHKVLYAYGYKKAGETGV